MKTLKQEIEDAASECGSESLHDEDSYSEFDYMKLRAFWRIAQAKALEELCGLKELYFSERQRSVIRQKAKVWE